MNVFTEVYDKSRLLLISNKFDENWEKIIVELKSLLASSGPDPLHSTALDKLRTKLVKDKSWYHFSGEYIAKEIIKASKTQDSGFQERCALLKTMNHFYFVSKKGGQSIWVVDSPKKYDKWAYDFLENTSKDLITSKLNKSGEVFGECNRTIISDSFQHARKVSSLVEIELAKNNDIIKNKVKRWFHLSDATDAEVNANVAVLLTGFKKIHAACNSGKVIFSDRPHLRAGGTYNDTYASVNARDKMMVIYIYELFLTTGRRTFFGNIPKLWLCSLTIIHELTHKVVHTKDHRYDTDGLKPSNTTFTTAKAITNADSWAYFAADVTGTLSKGTIKSVLK